MSRPHHNHHHHHQGNMLWSTYSPDDEWFCYMFVTTDTDDADEDTENEDEDDDDGVSGISSCYALSGANIARQSTQHQQETDVLRSLMRDRFSAGNISQFKQRYTYSSYRPSVKKKNCGDAKCTENAVNGDDAGEAGGGGGGGGGGKEELSEHAVIRKMVLKCFKKFGISINRDQAPKRTVLGCSQYPYSDLMLYNQHGPTRSSSGSSNSAAAAAAMVAGMSVPTYTGVGGGSGGNGGSGGGGGGGGYGTGAATEHHHGRFPTMMKRKPRSRKKRPHRYKMALIISGFGTDGERAMRFYNKWNEKSRGPVPRAAKGAYQATLWGLKIYGDWNAIFNCSFTFYTVECVDGKMMFSLRPEFARNYPLKKRLKQDTQRIAPEHAESSGTSDDDDDDDEVQQETSESNVRHKTRYQHHATSRRMRRKRMRSITDNDDDCVSERDAKRRKRNSEDIALVSTTTTTTATNVVPSAIASPRADSIAVQ